MASGGSDTNYSRCSMCSDDGRDSIARHYCLECEVYFCTECVKCHKLPALKTHQVNDVDGPDPVARDGTTERGSEVPTERGGQGLRCTIHDQLVDTYCQKHDEVFCGTCAVVKHRSCTTTSIAVASMDFKSSPDIKKSQEGLTKNLTLAKQERTKRVDNIEGIQQQKQKLIREVDEYEEKLIARIKELANVSREEIRSKHEELKISLNNEVTALDAVMTTSTSYLNKLEDVEDEELLFSNVKRSAIVTQEGETLLQTMVTEWKERELNFNVDDSVVTFVNEVKSLVQIVPGQDNALNATFQKNIVPIVLDEYNATFQKNVDIKRNDSNSHVFDMCLMNSSDIVLTDDGNKKLKRFTSDLIYKDELVLSGQPVAVCVTGKYEVAVRIETSKVVHFVSVGESMQLTSSFTLDTNGWGMTCDAGTGEIYACENNKVSVYSKTGTKLRTYDQDPNGEQIFSVCVQIVLSENKQDIYVTDRNKGLIVLDKNGSVKRKVSLTDVSGAWPLCLLPGGVCLVGGWSSDVIAVIDKTGKQVRNLIDSREGRTNTRCALYDREHKRLLVGGNCSLISVYTLSAKYN